MLPDPDLTPADALIESVDRRISAVRTQSIDLSFNEIADMYAADELIIQPEFQRMFRWSEGAQSRFIESLLLELPIPPIFLIERDDRIYELIDGLQRVSSYLHFRGGLRVPDGQLASSLRLSDCDIVETLNGLTQSDLPRSLDIKLKRSYVRAEILRKESDPRLRYYMFKRLNTGGELLSQQEVRNATIRLLSDTFNDFLVRLSETNDFTNTIDAISENARQQRFDQELVLRFFAFKNNIAGYRHDVADFLTEYMEGVSDPDSPRFAFDYASEEAVFTKTFAILCRVAEASGFGPRIFGSVNPRTGQPRGQFSVYHFEGLTLGLQGVLDEVDVADLVQIKQLADVVVAGKADPVFLESTGAGKNDRIPLLARIRYFDEKFTSALQR